MKTYLIPLVVFCIIVSIGTSRASDQKKDTSCKRIPFKKFQKQQPFSAYSLQFRIDGKKYVFPDIGCAVTWRDKQCSSRQGAFDGSASVFDFNSGQKIDAPVAIFVKSNDITSPNSYGLAAFRSIAGAEKFLTENDGTILSYEEIMSLSFDKAK